MNGLKRLIREVHRRPLWQVLGIYLAGAWVARFDAERGRIIEFDARGND